MAVKPLFIVGAVGYILAMIGVIWYLADWLFLVTAYEIDIIFVWLFTVGLLLGSFAYLGYKSYYESTLGLVTFILTMILIWFYPVGFTMWLTPFWAIGLLLEMVGLILLGVVFILFGVSKIVVRNETGQMGVTLAAGILFILAGGFFCSFFFDIIGYILLLPACIVGMTSLFLSLQ